MESPSIAATRKKRRSTEKNTSDKFAELRELKRKGVSRLATYKVKEEEDIYETVNEEDYQAIVKGRLQEDDFVVDDDGSGYIDNGLEDWDREAGDSDDDDDDEVNVAGRPKKKGDKKHKRRKKDDAEKVKPNGQINSFFKRGAAANVGVAKKITNTATDNDFMTDLLKDLENEAPQPILTTSSLSRPSRTTNSLAPPPAPALALSRRPLASKFDEHTTFTPPSTRNSFPRTITTTDPARRDDDDRRVSQSEPMDDSNVDDFSFDDDDFAAMDALLDSETTMMEVDPPSETPTGPSDPSPVPLKFNPLQTQARDARRPIAVVNASSSRAEPPRETQRPTVVKAEPSGYQAWEAVRAEMSGSGTAEPAMGENRMGERAEVVEEDGSVRIWWFDALERQGVVYLFGKVLNKAT
ncbi:DNA polymerase alpha subunit p180 N terminal-domain-containing protein, partial [Jimgerdemannia flammicorona]